MIISVFRNREYRSSAPTHWCGLFDSAFLPRFCGMSLGLVLGIMISKLLKLALQNSFLLDNFARRAALLSIDESDIWGWGSFLDRWILSDDFAVSDRFRACLQTYPPSAAQIFVHDIQIDSLERVRFVCEKLGSTTALMATLDGISPSNFPAECLEHLVNSRCYPKLFLDRSFCVVSVSITPGWCWRSYFWTRVCTTSARCPWTVQTGFFWNG